MTFPYYSAEYQTIEQLLRNYYNSFLTLLISKAGYPQPKDEVVSYQLSVVSTGGYFKIWGFGSMEDKL